MFIMKKNPKSFVAENYRSLRASLEYSSVDKRLKTIVITSSNPAEGKSTVTGNLAYALAESDKNVLVIDGDLRKSSIYKRFKISNEKGLTDILINKIGIKEAIVKVEEKVHVIPSGQKAPNPAEMVGSKAMAELLEKLCEYYDYILIDTPPVRAISDGQVLAAKCDGTILVIKMQDTKGKYVTEGYEALKKVNANVIGTVMNGVKKKRDKDYYYYED